MAGLYGSIETDIQTLFAGAWSHADVPVYWRTNDLDPMPDPSTIAHFIRATVLFGSETTIAFGAGRLANQKIQFGMVEFVGFAGRARVSETTLLDLLADAMSALRSKRSAGTYAGGSDLSFTGDGSGFHVDPEETGNWFIRGVRAAFEYRFIG